MECDLILMFNPMILCSAFSGKDVRMLLQAIWQAHWCDEKAGI